MQASIERAFDQRCMTARRGADVDEIELFSGQEIIDGSIPSAIGTGGEKGLAARRGGVGRSHNPHILTGSPTRQVAVGRDIAEADERPFEHSAAQSRLNRRAIAAND